MRVRAFPILYARDVEKTAAFYEALDFTRHFQLPPDRPAEYVGLRGGTSEIAVVASLIAHSAAAGTGFELPSLSAWRLGG